MSNSTYRTADPLSAPYVKQDASRWPFATSQAEFLDTPHGAASLKTSAMDLAVFGQTHLNGGIYEGHRLLNDGTVAEMTRNQIPGIGGVSPLGSWVAEGSWGLGWMVQHPAGPR